MPNGGHYNRKTQLRKQPGWPAKKRRLERGALKLARQHARDTERALRISLHPQPVPVGDSSVEPDPTIASDPAPTTHTVNPHEEYAA